jgi:hypothetical protein
MPLGLGGSRSTELVARRGLCLRSLPEVHSRDALALIRTGARLGKEAARGRKSPHLDEERVVAVSKKSARFHQPYIIEPCRPFAGICLASSFTWSTAPSTSAKSWPMICT